jgi:hypothetical protein
MAYDAAAIMQKGAKNSRTNFRYCNTETNFCEGAKNQEKVRKDLLPKKVQVSNVPLSTPFSGTQLACLICFASLPPCQLLQKCLLTVTCPQTTS